MVKVNNKLWTINFEQLTINSPWSSDSIVNFEQVNAGWVYISLSSCSSK